MIRRRHLTLAFAVGVITANLLIGAAWALDIPDWATALILISGLAIAAFETAKLYPKRDAK